jgi:crotonobetainyl-CoA:carnitine CoA-transferase CaiB-like acyl-CoA transferase
VLGGGFAPYGLYEARDGWVAVAALEPHFAARLEEELGADFPARLRERTADEWEAWADERDLPIASVRTTLGS